VPMLRPGIDTLAPTSQPELVDSYASSPGVLYVRLVPGAASSFLLFDGTVLGQQEGGDELELAYRPGEEFAQGALFEALAFGTPAPLVVTDGARPLPQVPSLAALEAAEEGWCYSPQGGGLLRVKVGAGEHQVTVQLER